MHVLFYPFAFAWRIRERLPVARDYRTLIVKQPSNVQIAEIDAWFSEVLDSRHTGSRSTLGATCRQAPRFNLTVSMQI